MAKIKGCQIAKIQKAAKKNQKAHLFFFDRQVLLRKTRKRSRLNKYFDRAKHEQRDNAAIHKKKRDSAARNDKFYSQKEKRNP